MARPGLRLTDLNDFISPSQACIKPVEAPVVAPGAKRAVIAIEADGSYVSVQEGGSRAPLPKVGITLQDCLACSGCVTSAESVLIELQTYKELQRVLGDRARNGHGPVVVVSLSLPSCAALAARHGLPLAQATGALAAFLTGLGVDFVFDTTLAGQIALLESYAEFQGRRARAAAPGALPMLASACPGWICYAEKTHGEYVLPFISTTKSPQQIMGTAVKSLVAQHFGRAPADVYHVTVMPCYDKKLEASRADFYSDVFATRDVDCVVATGELDMLLRDAGASLAAIPPRPLDVLPVPGLGVPPADELLRNPGGASGGFLDYLFKRTAREVYGIDVAEVPFTSASRSQRGGGGGGAVNGDFLEATLTVDGVAVLVVARAYGFKSIQNIVRKIKTGKCNYHFIEIMACPKGCNNGGGQPTVAPAPADTDARPFDFEATELAYNEATLVADPLLYPGAADFYAAWQHGAAGLDPAALHTVYHHVPMTILPQMTGNGW